MSCMKCLGVAESFCRNSDEPFSLRLKRGIWGSLLEQLPFRCLRFSNMLDLDVARFSLPNTVGTKDLVSHQTSRLAVIAME